MKIDPETEISKIIDVEITVIQFWKTVQLKLQIMAEENRI